MMVPENGALVPAAEVAPPEAFLRDVVRGLRRRPRQIPPKWFYAARGSELFEAICDLPEYYPTRTEIAILERHAVEMARALGPRCLVVEYGSGSSRKTPLVLARLEAPAGYVPVDVSRAALVPAAAAIAARFPSLAVRPVCADFTGPFEVPAADPRPRRRAVWFPGSTIGNFRPAEAVRLMRAMGRVAGTGGALLIGVDLRKDRATLERAYDDAQGVTAAFNLNLLARANRELGADFRLPAFRHRAFFEPGHGRIEMHLECLERQEVHVGGAAFRLRAGEHIVTEYSYKYRPREFAALAARAGWRVARIWTDPAALFSVQLLERRR